MVLKAKPLNPLTTLRHRFATGSKAVEMLHQILRDGSDSVQPEILPVEHPSCIGMI